MVINLRRDLCVRFGTFLKVVGGWFMNKRKIVISFLHLLPALLVLSGMGGCFKAADKSKMVLPDIVWPSAPETPRIKFVNTVSKPEDLQIKSGGFKEFFDYWTGKTEKTITAPYGIVTDSTGRIYVVDTFLKTVHVYDSNENSYHTFPAGKAYFTSPIDIAIDNTSGYIYVTDSAQKVVKIFKNQGKEFIGQFGKGVLERPTGIAVNGKTSELLVVDTLSANILRYALKDHHLKSTFGGTGNETGKFHYPTNIFVTTGGNIIISDSLNFRVQVFSANGKFLRQFGAAGENPGYFTRPKGVAADSDGNIYVVDSLFDNIQMFDGRGRLLMAFGSHGTSYGEFWLPSGIFIDHNDTIYVSDSYNRRVQIFRYIKRGERIK